MKRIYALNESELRQLGVFLGINIDSLVGTEKDKRRALINYVTYGALKHKVEQWLKKHYGIAISYSYSRAEWAIQLKERLAINGYNPMFDQTDIGISGRCISSFEQILSEQPIFIGILNDNYFESLNCMRELYLFCSRYNFNTNLVSMHFVAIWDGDLQLSFSKIDRIVNRWRDKIEQHNKLTNNHCCAVREKLIAELDWYAKIYHQCANIMLMIKDISAIIINGNMDDDFPLIEKIIDEKLSYILSA